MGFLDKVKNMFTEEVEDDDVKVEQIKKEVTQVSIESPKVKKEEFEYEDEGTKEFKFDAEEKVNKPVFFDDNDFRDLSFSAPKVEEKKPVIKEKEKDVYGIRRQEEKEVIERKSFKPTPIISPVYGILDKNYHKEDIVSRTEQPVKVTSNNNDVDVSIDSIRNKAYGTLEDELENTLFGSNSILFKKDESDIEPAEINEISDDALTNLTDDISKELDELLIKKEKYLDEKVEDTDSSLDDDDLLGFIDSTLYKDGDEE